MSTWLVPESGLTPEQTRAVRLGPEEHRVIFGSPGSGKTLVLLHRAKHLCRTMHVKPDRFKIFVFTKVLKSYIQSALALLDLPLGSVTNFDAWCYSQYTRLFSRNLPWNDEGGVPDFAAMRQRILEKLRGDPTERRVYDFVLVDEGQDLDSASFEILTLVSMHVTVCMDPKQQIFEGGASEAQVLKALGMRKRNMSLLEAYRCTPYIVAVASSFIADEADRTAYTRQVKVPQVERETPLLFVARGPEEEKKRLIELVRMRQAKGETVAVLLPHRAQVAELAEAFRIAGLEVEVPVNRGERSGHRPLDFRSDLPKMMPYPGAKGLTFDAVLLPCLTSESFHEYSEERMRRLLFVATSRAMRWLYFSTVQGCGIPLPAIFEGLGKGGNLSIQEEGAPAQTQSHTPKPPTPSGPGKISDWF